MTHALAPRPTRDPAVWIMAGLFVTVLGLSGAILALVAFGGI